MTIGEELKFYRKKKGLTQKQLGKMCGMHEVQIRRYELGLANPKIETVDKIAEALGVSIFDLKCVEINHEPVLDGQKEWRLEQFLRALGYDIVCDLEGTYLYRLEYPDGTLDVTEEQLAELEATTSDYLLFQLEQLKKKNPKYWRPKK